MKEILDFLGELACNNNREWFEAHKDTYTRCRKQFEAFSAEFIRRLSEIDPTIAGLQPKDAPTRRERDVLEAVAKGMNTHEIADLLKISENTVETFRKRLISKFGAKNAIDMVVKAVAQGWIALK